MLGWGLRSGQLNARDERSHPFGGLIDFVCQVGVDLARGTGVRLAPRFRDDELRRPFVCTASHEDRFGGFANLDKVIPEQFLGAASGRSGPRTAGSRGPGGCSVTAWSFCATWKRSERQATSSRWAGVADAAIGDCKARSRRDRASAGCGRDRGLRTSSSLDGEPIRWTPRRLELSAQRRAPVPRFTPSSRRSSAAARRVIPPFRSPWSIACPTSAAPTCHA